MKKDPNDKGEGRCKRCGGPLDSKFQTCKPCRDFVNDACKRRREAGLKNPDEGFDNSVPMEPEIEDPTVVEPTKFHPGTVEKVDVMGMRYDLGLPLFAPDDAKGVKGLPSGKHR